MAGSKVTGSKAEHKSPPALIQTSVTAAGGGPFTGGPFTAGSILFAGGGFVITENNPNLFFDAVAMRVGIGTNVPSFDLHVQKSSLGGTVTICVENTSAFLGSACFDVRVPAATGGDPFFSSGVIGGGSWNFGADNSVTGDPFVFTANAALGNAATTFFLMDPLGNVVSGSLFTLAQAATDGFFHIPLIADAPTAVPPTLYAGKSPIAIDATNDLLTFFSNGAWHTVGAGGAGTLRNVFDGVTLFPDMVGLYFDETSGFTAALAAVDVVKITMQNFTDLVDGNVPASGGGATNFLRADGTWAVPAGAVPAGTGGVVFATGGILLSDPTQFFYDDPNNRVGIGTNAPGMELDISKSVAGGTVIARVRNTDNTNAASTAGLVLTTGGASAGDPFLTWNIDAVTNWTAGPDNSVADTWMLSQGASIGGASTFLRVDVAGNVVAGSLSALGLAATDGFFYLPTSAGTPAGVPTVYAAKAPVEIDTTNNLLYFYSSGAWRLAGGGAFVPTSRVITTTAPVRIDGGASADLSADRTLSVNTFGAANSGIVPLSGGGTTNFLRADGTWDVPPGSGGGSIWPIANPPTVSNWTWVNQGTATAADNADGSITMSALSAGAATNLRALVRSLASSTDFDVKIGMILQPQALQSTEGGLILRESSTGKMLFTRMGLIAGSPDFSIYNMTNVTTYGSSQFNPAGTDFFMQLSPAFFRFTRAASGNIFFYYSLDGQYWTSPGSIGATNPFTTAPDQYGFALDANNGTIFSTVFYLSAT